MPNRIIKESAFTSDRIAALSDFEFRLWVGLITQADDAGRGDARPAIIKGHVFPLRERVTIKDIENALHGLAAAGCVSLYSVGGKPYYAFPSWTAHQRIRDCKPKFPGVEESDLDDLPQVAASCGELPQIAADCRLNPNPNPNTNPNTYFCTEQAPVQEAVAWLTLNDNSRFGFAQEDIDLYTKTYPAVDVLSEIRKMEAWGDANKAKRKTKSGIKRFVNSWLAREQDKPHVGGAKPAPSGKRRLDDDEKEAIRRLMEGGV